MTAVESRPCSSARDGRKVTTEKAKRIIDILNVASITLTSVAVVSRPVNAHQSLTTRPAPMTSEPRLTVPAYIAPQKITTSLLES
jgi:hypothetical protein